MKKTLKSPKQSKKIPSWRQFQEENPDYFMEKAEKNKYNKLSEMKSKLNNEKADSMYDKKKAQKTAFATYKFGNTGNAFDHFDKKQNAKFIDQKVAAGKAAFMSNKLHDKKNQGKLRLNTVKDSTLSGITKPAIRRLARRGGVKRISKPIYDEIRQELRLFLESTLRDATTYTEHAKRKTVKPLDIVYALKRKGRDLYGYGM